MILRVPQISINSLRVACFFGIKVQKETMHRKTKKSELFLEFVWVKLRQRFNVT
jgi:hypothetical protein